LAFDNAGKSIPARIAMMAITTSNSINVKPVGEFREGTADISQDLSRPFGTWAD
jgi:hypothetical protein